MIKKVSFLILIVILISLSYSQKTPDQFFGKKIGGDRTLIVYPEIIKYFEHLAQHSKRVKVSNEGLSTLKNRIYLIFISSEENINNLKDLAALNKKLANPDKIGESEAKSYIKNGIIK